MVSDHVTVEGHKLSLRFTEAEHAQTAVPCDGDRHQRSSQALVGDGHPRGPLQHLIHVLVMPKGNQAVIQAAAPFVHAGPCRALVRPWHDRHNALEPYQRGNSAAIVHGRAHG